MPRKIKKNKIFVEKLNHFVCEKCKKWWTVGDAPIGKKKWFCPWCGHENEYSGVIINTND